jgi:RNA polymerase sigma factor (sigma-70 family)
MGISTVDLEEHRTTLMGRARTLKYLWGWPPEVEVEDVVSDTLIRAIQRIDSYHGNSRGELASWLLAVLNSEIIDTLRRVGADKRGGGRVRAFEDFISESQSRFEKFFAADISTVSSPLQRQELIQAAYSAIELLPSRQRTVLLARFIGEWSISDIAADLNRLSPNEEPTTEKAVTSLLERALKKLRDLLQHLR